MSDQPPEAKDFPDHWGFYLLQAINRLDDKIDQVRHEQQRTADALRQEIDGVRQEIGGVRQDMGSIRQDVHALDVKFDQKIEALDAKYDHKLTNAQYWYIGTLFVILVGFVTIILTHA